MTSIVVWSRCVTGLRLTEFTYLRKICDYEKKRKQTEWKPQIPSRADSVGTNALLWHVSNFRFQISNCLANIKWNHISVRTAVKWIVNIHFE